MVPLGSRPNFVLGHSLGEYAALFASGVLSASDTLSLVGHRTMLLEFLSTRKSHSMLAVDADLTSIE